MFQEEIAETIIERVTDYALSVKKNRLHLYEGIADTFAQAEEGGGIDFFETVEKGHGRIETRRCWPTSDADCLNYLNDEGQWKKLGSVAMVEATRRERGETSVESRYYISSLPSDAERMLAATRVRTGA